MKYPVNSRALIQRINRRLAQDKSQLKTGRGRCWNDLGYYVVDAWNNIAAHNVNLEAMAKELGCLGLAEELRDE